MEGSSGNSTPSVPGPVLTSDKPTFFCNKVLAGGFWWTYVPPPQPATTKQKVWLHLSILTPALPAGKTCNRVKKCEVAVMVFRGKSAVVPGLRGEMINKVSGGLMFWCCSHCVTLWQGPPFLPAGVMTTHVSLALRTSRQRTQLMLL